MNDFILKYEASPVPGNSSFSGVSMGIKFYPSQAMPNHQPSQSTSNQHMVLHQQSIINGTQPQTTGQGIIHFTTIGKPPSPVPTPLSRKSTRTSRRHQSPAPVPPEVFRATYTREVTSIEEPYHYFHSPKEVNESSRHSHDRGRISHGSSRRTRSRGEALIHDEAHQTSLGEDTYYLGSLRGRNIKWDIISQPQSSKPDGEFERHRHKRYYERSEETHFTHFDTHGQLALLGEAPSSEGYSEYKGGHGGYQVHRIEESGSDKESGGRRWWNRRVLQTEREF